MAKPEQQQQPQQLLFDDDAWRWSVRVVGRDYGHFHVRMRRMDRTIVSSYILPAFHEVSSSLENKDGPSLPTTCLDQTTADQQSLAEPRISRLYDFKSQNFKMVTLPKS